MTDVRLATASDIDFLVSIAREKYPDFDLSHARAWGLAVVQMPNVAIIICGSSAAAVAWQVEFWRPNDRIADILFIFGRVTADNPFAQYRAIKGACDWAKSQGCYAIRFGCRIGAQAKRRKGVEVFTAFARRLKAKVFDVTYILEFADWAAQSNRFLDRLLDSVPVSSRLN